MSDCDNAAHGGHRIYMGGIMDGEVAHVIAAPDRCPSDYPNNIGTVRRHGQRSWYVLDRFDGTTAIYRLAGVAATPPPEVAALHSATPVPRRPQPATNEESE